MGPRTANQHPIAILSYHQTAEPAGIPPQFRSLVLSPRQFSLQMSLLHLMGWKGLSMRDLEPYLRGERRGKVFGITLDDGYVNNLEHALPVLRRVGFTATSFVVSGQIGGSNVWDHRHGIPPASLMNVAQMRAWLDAGMEIGGHTRNHVSLRDCGDDALAQREVTDCKADLEDALGIEIRSFCYPHGEFHPRHVEMVRGAGYAMATTVEASRVAAGNDLLRLPRISVHASDSISVLLARVTSPVEEWRARLRRMRRRFQAHAPGLPSA